MTQKKLLGKGRLPKVENLQKLDIEQLKNVLHRFGIDGTEIRNQMLREFSPIASRISQLKRQGLKIDDVLLNQLRGQIKRKHANLELRMAGKAINQYNVEKTKLLEKDDLSKRIWVWVTKFKRSCDSCIARHNQVKSLNEWQRLGMPKSDVLLCDGYCHCDIEKRPEILNESIEYNPSDLEKLRTKKRSKREIEEIRDLMS